MGFVSSLTSGEMSAEHAYPLITSHASAGKTLTIDMSLSQSMRENKQKKKKKGSEGLTKGGSHSQR